MNKEKITAEIIRKYIGKFEPFEFVRRENFFSKIPEYAFFLGKADPYLGMEKDYERLTRQTQDLFLQIMNQIIGNFFPDGELFIETFFVSYVERSFEVTFKFQGQTELYWYGYQNSFSESYWNFLSDAISSSGICPGIKISSNSCVSERNLTEEEIGEILKLRKVFEKFVNTVHEELFGTFSLPVISL